MSRAGLLWLALVGCEGTIHIPGHADAPAIDEDTDTDQPACEPFAEAPNAVDDDCDGLIDEDFVGEGDVVVTEVMVAPAAAVETVGEWLEIENRSERIVDLTGWELRSTLDEVWVMPSGVQLDPGERAVLGVSADPVANGGVTVDVVYERSAVALANTADGVSLLVEGRRISAVSWVVSEIGASLSLDPDLPDRWCASATLMPSGDRGTPGQPNETCEIVVDRDGDGWTSEDGDCDDADADVSPGATEGWNGRDDDCDGRVDDVTIETIATGWLDGGPDERLGFASALSWGDLDADGATDLVLGGAGVGPDHYGGAYLVAQAAAVHATGSAARTAFATVSVDVGVQGLRMVGPHQADLTGDGLPDLAMAAPVGELLLIDGAGISTGDIEAHSSVVSSYGLYFSARLSSDGDLDGDGVAEILVSGSWWPEASWDSDGCGVFVVEASDLADGASSLASTDAAFLREEAAADNLGAALSTGDVDGDGYADLLATAPEADPSGLSSGYAYFVRGGPEPLESSGIADAADGRIAGLVRGGAFGLSGGPVVFDADGDGAAEVAIGSIQASTVWIFDASAMSGEHTTDDARSVLSAQAQPAFFGAAMAAGDLDGDGKSELLVAATDDAEEYTGFASGANEPGALFIFGAAALDGGAFDTSAARLLLGDADGDLFGTSVSLPDLDGDGDADLMVASPGRDAGSGRVWFAGLD